MILKKLLFTTFYVTSSCFSRICFVIILSAPKLVKCIVYHTTQQVDEALAVRVKIMIDFLCRSSDKARKKYQLLVYLYIDLYFTHKTTLDKDGRNSTKT